MRYFICKVEPEQKIKPETDKGVSAMEQFAEKSVSYIEKNSSEYPAACHRKTQQSSPRSS